MWHYQCTRLTKTGNLQRPETYSPGEQTQWRRGDWSKWNSRTSCSRSCQKKLESMRGNPVQEQQLTRFGQPKSRYYVLHSASRRTWHIDRRRLHPRSLLSVWNTKTAQLRPTRADQRDGQDYPSIRHCWFRRRTSGMKKLEEWSLLLLPIQAARHKACGIEVSWNSVTNKETAVHASRQRCLPATYSVSGIITRHGDWGVMFKSIC